MDEPPQVAKIRKCINCQKDFKSKSAGHRICPVYKKLTFKTVDMVPVKEKDIR